MYYPRKEMVICFWYCIIVSLSSNIITIPLCNELDLSLFPVHNETL